MGSLA